MTDEHKEPLGDRIGMRVVNTIAWLWRTAGWAVIALALIPLPPFQWLALYTAVSHGHTRTVKLLARRWVFALMPSIVNSKIMWWAGHRASTSESTPANEKIFKWLLGHGGILTQKSFDQGWLYTYFSVSSFAAHDDCVEHAIVHNAIADNVKYDVLLACLRYSHYGSKYANPRLIGACHTMLSSWGSFFNTLQKDEEVHNKLWTEVLKDGNPQAINHLVQHTPTDRVQSKMRAVLLNSKCSVDRLHAVARHMDVDDLLHTLHKQSLVSANFDQWLDKYPALREAYTQYSNQQQNARLRQHIEEYEPIVGKRKM